jgi:V-type H+-transporting ATPase subunit E
MIKLLEDDLEVMVREEEVDLVNGMLAECQEEYTDIMKRETTRDYACNLTVIEDRFLTSENGGRCGGVVLLALNRRIVCSNTLEDRLG